MLLRSVRIRNIKAISDLTVNFDDHAGSVSLIYGGNGVGKTTVLEAISLIGHLPCMSRVEFEVGGQTVTVKSSLLYEKLGKPREHAGDALFEGPVDLCGADSLTDFFEKAHIGDPVETPHHVGGVYFHVRDMDQGKDLRFVILVKKPPSKDNGHPLQITSLLSQSVPDLFAGKHFVVVYLDHDHFDRFLLKLYYSRAYTLPDKGHMDPRMSAPTADTGLINSLSTSYVNTDLNDFGRGNDLRESPKDLGKNFKAVMIDRLAVPFERGSDGVSRFSRTAELSNTLKRIVRSPEDLFSRPDDLQNRFELKACEIDGEGHFALRASRYVASKGDAPEYSVDYLSAGENETFFVFLVVMGLPQTRLLLLMDEPDLHLATTQKQEFFEELYTVARARNAQLIIATHSLFPLIAARRLHAARPTEVSAQVIWGRVVSVDGTPVVAWECGNRTAFFLGLTKRYLVTAIRSLATIPRAFGWRLLYLAPLEWFRSSREELPTWAQRTYSISACAILLSALTFAIGLLLAGLNDLFTEAPDTPHETIRGWAEAMLSNSLVFFAVASLVAFLIRRVRKKKARSRDSISS